jgi:dihydrolipoamide dehydrogenase
MEKKYDVAVIGGGPGGYVAAIRAAQLGFKTVCIDKRKTLGGTCLNVGCIPSKALLQSTEYYDWLMKSSKEHGIHVKEHALDFNQMMDRKAQVVKGLVDGVAFLLKKNKVEWIEGEASFSSPKTLQVNQQTIEADHFILATGSDSIALPFLPFDEKNVLSSTGALSLPTIPKKMLVIGAGVIGVELASVYRRLGTEIVIIEMLDRICPAMDEAVSKMLLQILKKQGMTFHLGAKVTQANVQEKSVTLSVQIDNRQEQLEGDVVLVAVGRKPYSGGLNLKEIGLQVDARGFVQVNDRFQTNLPHIYAIGDLIDGVMLAHRASEEGLVVAEIMAGRAPHLNYMAIPNIIYTHPEVAAVGLTEEEAKAAGLEVIIGKSLFRGNARARCAGETEGMVKVIGDKKSDRLMGLHIIGAHASELIAEGVIAIEKRATLEEIAHASHGHPTLTEAIHEAVLDALGRPLNQ